jgi:hypothetical protein
MAVPRPLGAESPLPPGIDRLRWGERPALDPAARSLVASLCDAVEGEVVTLTRRLGACQAAAREAARALGEGLAALAGHGPAEQERAERDRAAARLVALASLAASLEADLDRCAELVQALPRRVLPLLRRSELTDRRRHPRTPIARPATLLLAGRRGDCLTLDLSEGGALVRLAEPWPELEDPTGLAELQLGGVGRLPALLVGRSPLGLHLAFRTCAPAVRAALAQLLREARRAERALLAAARRIVDDLVSWWVDPSGRPTSGPGDGPGHALQVFDLHLRREPRLVAAQLFAADGTELAARVPEEGGPPREPPPEAPERGAVRCRVVPPPPHGPIDRAWMRIEAEVGDAARTIGTLRLYAPA